MFTKNGIGVVPYRCSTHKYIFFRRAKSSEYRCGRSMVLTDRSKYMYCKFLDFDILLCALDIQKQNYGIGNAQQGIL